MVTQIVVKIENQKQNIISNLFQDLKLEKKLIFQLLKYVDIIIDILHFEKIFRKFDQFFLFFGGISPEICYFLKKAN